MHIMSGYLTTMGAADLHTYTVLTSNKASQNANNIVTSGDYDTSWHDFDYPDLALPTQTQASLVILYVITSILAIFGNILAIVVLTLGNRSRTELGRYLINLAVAHCLMAIFCIPFTFTKTMLGRWIFGRAMCPLVLFMQILSVAVSILTNAAIAIDRYVAVSYPMKQRITKTKTIIVIVFIWTLGVFTAIAQLIVGRTEVFYYDGQYYDQCSEHWKRQSHRQTYTVILFLVTYVMPISLIAWTYFVIVRTLWRRKLPGVENARRDTLQLLSRRKVTKMLVTVVLVFAICWLPIHVFTLVIDFAPQVLDTIRTAWHEKLYLGMFYCCHWLAMANSLVNPAIYCFMNDSFRADLKYLCRKSPCHPCLSTVVKMSSSDRTLKHHGSYVLASSKHLVTKRSSSSSSRGQSSGTARSILQGRLDSNRKSPMIELEDQMVLSVRTNAATSCTVAVEVTLPVIHASRCSPENQSTNL